MSATLHWISLADSPPARDPLLSEQSILTWDERSGTFGLIFYEGGDSEAIEWIGLTHWADITTLAPEGKGRKD